MKLKQTTFLFAILTLLSLSLLTSPVLAQSEFELEMPSIPADEEPNYLILSDIIITDPVDALPNPGCPISGFDMDEITLSYDGATGSLIVTISAHGGAIVGDADGDGDPSAADACLSGSGGSDLPDLGGFGIGSSAGEAIDMLLDVDQDGTPEFIIGVPLELDITGFSVANYDVTNPLCNLFAVGQCYGTAAGTGSIVNNPSASNPDFVFAIDDFTSLLVSSGLDFEQFCVGFRAGSFVDAGGGEDYTDSCIAITFAELTAVELSVTAVESPPANSWSLALIMATIVLIGLTVRTRSS